MCILPSYFIHCSNELLGRIGPILKYFILAGTESLAPHFSRCDNAVLMLPTSKFRSLPQSSGSKIQVFKKEKFREIMLDPWSYGFLCVIDQLNVSIWHNEDLNLIMEA